MTGALDGQLVLVLGGSGGIGLETARSARAEGAQAILTGRNEKRLAQAAAEVGAQSTAAFDVNDPAALADFFGGLPDPVDHVMVTAGRPRYAALVDMTPEEVRDAVVGAPRGGPRGGAPRARPRAARRQRHPHERHWRTLGPGRQPGGRRHRGDARRWRRASPWSSRPSAST